MTIFQSDSTAFSFKRLITNLLFIAVFFPSSQVLAAQLFASKGEVTQQDILRGSITPEREWWDLTHYHLDIKVDPENKSISGTNTMKYKVLSQQKALQVELQQPLILDKVTQNGKILDVTQQGYSYFIKALPNAEIGKEYAVVMHFSGIPKEAIKAPWDGGITWNKDENDIDFIASSCQGLGASIWWPNKDHAYDEPNDGVLISVEVPEHLFDVSNGRLTHIDHNKAAKTKTYHWEVTNPINNYGVNINIGDYVNFNEVYQGENGKLDMNYYVLRDNLAKAKKQFKEAKRTIEALEHWFGPYPFYEDSYKLVEAPYLGMEHQSSVTYGNGYQNGYLGSDRSQTGVGMLFDFIIVHETGHEWFANNITSVDIADMWIHESFTSYSESLFVEYHFGKEKSFEYVRGQRMNIKNKSPIIGTYNIHQEGSGDMYDKGANMLHTIRQVVNNDSTWRELLRGLNKTFFHQTVTTQQVEQYINQTTGHDFSKVFDQYLRDIRIPTLEYFVKGTILKVKWSNVVDDFTMPIKIFINNKETWVTPTSEWTDVEIKAADPTISVDPNFYVNTLNILGNH
ncbi:M1 family metallopeptidase [Pseudocolwellia sp. HL-MZ19]|uniref:M1 family metallopeptidase n=1 Tax=Pseudocolwellia sp. HL-MZ19 TaxID=3400846 RepID=UPI003CF5EF23